jgi:nucleotide-binding universal stress UspA family protein
MRWFSSSTSEQLVQRATVPVTIVRSNEEEEHSVQQSIAQSLSGNVEHHHMTADFSIHNHADHQESDDTSPYSFPRAGAYEERPVRRRDDVDDMAEHNHQDSRPIVVGVDMSPTSTRALHFAAQQASVYGRALHIVYCWQLKDLGTIPGYENAVAPIDAAQDYAKQAVDALVSSSGIDASIDVHTEAFHIPAAKGLISASKYAYQLIVGSRGLSGLDAHFFGSVSKQIVSFAECTVSVVH